MVTGEAMSDIIHRTANTTHQFRRDGNMWILNAIVGVADIYLDFSRSE